MELIKLIDTIKLLSITDALGSAEARVFVKRLMMLVYPQIKPPFTSQITNIIIIIFLNTYM